MIVEVKSAAPCFPASHPALMQYSRVHHTMPRSSHYSHKCPRTCNHTHGLGHLAQTSGLIDLDHTAGLHVLVLVVHKLGSKVVLDDLRGESGGASVSIPAWEERLRKGVQTLIKRLSTPSLKTEAGQLFITIPRGRSSQLLTNSIPGQIKKSKPAPLCKEGLSEQHS